MRKRPFIRLRSSEVIDFGTNRKRVYTFLLVINNNFRPILHRFGDMAGLKFRKSPILPTPSSFNAPALGELLRISGWNLLSKN